MGIWGLQKGGYMIDKDRIVNGYKVLSEKLEERYLDLTVRQLKELDFKLEDTWHVLSPRGHDRRRGARP